MFNILDTLRRYVQNAIHMIARCLGSLDASHGRRPSRAWDRALNSFAPCANEPLDELTVAARTTLRAVASACQIATQTPATPEAGPQRLAPGEVTDDFSAKASRLSLDPGLRM